MRGIRLSLLSFTLLAAACGGAKDQDVLAESSSSSGSSGSTSKAGSSGGGGTSSSGASTSSSGGSHVDPVADGGGSCEQEREPNDLPKQANELTTSSCGVLSNGSDKEYLTFELPQGTKTMSLTFEGDIVMRVFVEGQDVVTISPKSNPPIPFVIGKPYYIEVTAFSGGKQPTWRVNLERT